MVKMIVRVIVSLGVLFVVMSLVALKWGKLKPVAMCLPSSDYRQRPSRTGKLAIVTGSSSGLGKALGEHLEREGYLVLRASRNENTLDLCDPQSIDDFAMEVSRAGVGVDLLINNAGIMGRCDDTAGARTNIETLESVFKTNVFGHHALSLALMKVFNPGATIVNISSTNGQLSTLGEQNGVADAYAMSKAALNACTLLLANKRKDLTVISLHPGLVKTAIHRPGDIRPMSSPKGVARDICRVLTGGKLRTGTFTDRHGRVIDW